MSEFVPLSASHNPNTLPVLITAAGERTTLRFFEFFAVNIRNPNTRAACARAAGQFLGWCTENGIPDLRAVQPLHVATYIEGCRSVKGYPVSPSWGNSNLPTRLRIITV